MANLTLLDIARMNAADGVVGLIEDTVLASPEIMGGTSRTIDGYMYETLHRTSVPAVGFRTANGDGVEKCVSTYELRMVQTYIVDCASEVDVAVAARNQDGPEAAIALEAEGIVEGAMRSLSSQFYYGRGTSGAGDLSIAPDNGLGFAGLAEVVDASLVVDATGTTSGSASSVYAVSWGTRNVSWVIGNGGQFDTNETYITPRRTGDKCLDVFRTPLLWNIGLQLVDKFSVGVIKNLTAEPGKGLTDDLIATLLSQFPSGRTPDVLYMSRRSKEQLRQSRTTFNPTGAPAAITEGSFEVPITDSDGILNTELVY